MLPKNPNLLPTDEQRVFLAHCSVSPLLAEAAAVIADFNTSLSRKGIRALPDYFAGLCRFHDSVGQLLRTTANNVAFVPNTATALNMVANGYPFSPGDQVISYIHEYPSNHYPWLLQRNRGVELILLADQPTADQPAIGRGPQGWSMAELAELVTKRTKVIALSHVQFASGYAADLQQLGEFCHNHHIDLVVDCAQSLGCLPVFPEEYGIAALAASGWKWLMGPLGSGVFYTSPQFRAKLQPTLVGTGLMRQGMDYLNLNWDPYPDARMFEYSTLPWDHILALDAVLSSLFLTNSIVDIRDEIFRLQDVFLHHLDPELCPAVLFPGAHRSGIVGLLPKGDLQRIIADLQQEDVIMTGPARFLRLAPHFHLTDPQMIRAARTVNAVCAKYL